MTVALALQRDMSLQKEKRCPFQEQCTAVPVSTFSPGNILIKMTFFFWAPRMHQHILGPLERWNYNNDESRLLSFLGLIDILATAQTSWALWCTHSKTVHFLTIKSSSIWIYLLLMVAHLHLPGPVALPCLNTNEASFIHGAIHCAICSVKHTGPLLKCHDAACQQRNKSL